MDFGAPVANGIKPPDINQGMQSLSSLMGLQQKGIEIQQAKQNLQTGVYHQQAAQGQAQQQQQLMAERQAMQKMHQTQTDPDGNRVFDDKGEPIPDKLAAAYLKHFPLLGQAANQAIIATQSAKVGLLSSSLKLTNEQRQAVAAPLQAVVNNPTEQGIADAKASLQSLVQQNPELAPHLKAMAPFWDHVEKAQTLEERRHLANALASYTQPMQAVDTQPKVTSTDTGPSVLQGTTRPPMQGGGFTPTTEIKKGLPPTTPMVRADGSTGYTGAPNVTASLPAMDTAKLGGWAKHWEGVKAEAEKAPERIALLTSARDNAVNAITGSGQVPKNFLNNIGSALGFEPSEKAKDSTDLYQKELNQYLASRGQGGTDMAKALAEGSAPGKHMNPDAVRKAFNGLIAQEKTKQAAAQFFGEVGSDPKAYEQRFKEWGRIGDYRAMQWNDMTKEEKAELKASLKKQGKPDESGLTPAEKDFLKAVDAFHKMGHVK